MKHSILLGALALLTACGSSRKAEESHTVERYHQQVEASVRTADSLAQRRVLVLDSPVIEIELPAESAASARRVRIAARRAALTEAASAITTIAADSAASAQAERRADATQRTDRRSCPWLVLLLTIILLCYLSRRFMRS